MIFFVKILIKYSLIKPLQIIVKIYFACTNFISLKIYQVNYSTFPKINGKLVIVNRGKCIFGKGLILNSSLKSNLVGLYKPCTILVSGGAELNIGDHSGFSGVSIYCNDKINIGKYCNIGGNTSIFDTDFHSLNYLERRKSNEGAKKKAITIGDDVFIGANSIILKGVTIGDRSIVGAGSVVSKNIPCDEIWAGNPAKFIKKIMI